MRKQLQILMGALIALALVTQPATIWAASAGPGSLRSAMKGPLQQGAISPSLQQTAKLGLAEVAGVARPRIEVAPAAPTMPTETPEATAIATEVPTEVPTAVAHRHAGGDHALDQYVRLQLSYTRYARSGCYAGSNCYAEGDRGPWSGGLHGRKDQLYGRRPHDPGAYRSGR